MQYPENGQRPEPRRPGHQDQHEIPAWVLDVSLPLTSAVHTLDARVDSLTAEMSHSSSILSAHMLTTRDQFASLERAILSALQSAKDQKPSAKFSSQEFRDSLKELSTFLRHLAWISVLLAWATGNIDPSKLKDLATALKDMVPFLH